jgi:two-component system phosphate regulon response regulator PhoB
MGKSKIIIVEDETDIRELLELNLLKSGYEVIACASGEEGLAQVATQMPDLMLLDLMLPGVSGLDVCRQVKEMPGANFPVIMVTARGSEQDIIAGLEMGADDYIVKPFSLPVLIARVKKALSRQGRTTAIVTEAVAVDAQGIVIDDRRHEVSVNGEKLDLTSSEFSLLKFLASHPGWVYTRSQIVKAVHGDNYPVTDRSVDVMILSLRRKLGERGTAIETVRGVGYRFEE